LKSSRQIFYKWSNLSGDGMNSSNINLKKITGVDKPFHSSDSAITEVFNLSETMKNISKANTFSEAAKLITDSAKICVNGEKATLFIPDKNNNLVPFCESEAADNSAYKDSINQNSDLIKQVFRTGKIKYLENRNGVPGYNFNGKLLHISTDFVFCAPMIANGEVCGILYVESPNINRNLAVELITKFEILSLYSGSVLKNHLSQESNNNLQKRFNETLELIDIVESRAANAEKVKDEFLAQISHEIRTPLNIIINYTDLIKDEVKDFIEKDTELFFNAIEVDSKRLMRTIDLMLNMAQIKKGKCKLQLEELDVVNSVVKSVISEFNVDLKEKNLKLQFDSTSKNNIVVTDKYAIEQVIKNLLDNAIKFTECGNIKVRAFNEADNLCISIQDSGRGISEEYLTKLFEPFSQEDHGLDRKHEGSGLGLAVVKRYLELIDGSLKVDTKKGQGSTFTIKLKTSI